MIGPLEIAANVMTGTCIFLAGRNNIHTWWTGIIGCSLFGVLFYQTQLYADVVLQLFFIISGVVGWRQWLKGNHGSALPISTTKPGLLALILLAGVLVTAGYGALLHYYTSAYAPFVDTTVLVFSVVAQLLLMQRKVENWPVWVVVNTIAVPLYASRELYLTAVLYGFFWVNAIVSWVAWRRQMQAAAIVPILSSSDPATTLSQNQS